MKARLTVDWVDEIDGLRGAVTVSIGVAEYPLHGEDSQELLRGADEALYRAKRRGKNRTEVAEPPVPTMSVPVVQLHH